MIILRIFTALILVVLWAILISLLITFIAKLQGTTVSSSYLLAYVLVGVIPIIMSSISSLDTKIVRLNVALLATLSAVALFSILQYALWTPTSDSVRMASRAGSLVIPLMALSAFLTIYWMPSWNTAKRTTTVPEIIKKSRNLIYFSLIVEIVMIFSMYESIDFSMIEKSSGMFYKGFAEDMYKSTILMLIFFYFVNFYAINVATNYGSTIWRNIITVIVIIPTLYMLFDFDKTFYDFSVLSILGYIISIVQWYAIYLLYKKDAKEWFYPLKSNN